MKVTLSVPGRLQAFHMAVELQERGHLKAIFSTYPKFEISKYEIERQFARPRIAIELVRRLWPRLPSFMGPIPDRKLLNFYDRQVSRAMPKDSDLFVGWTGSALKSLRRAKSLGIPTLLVRGSTHVIHQRDILIEEAEKWGTPLPDFDDALIDKQLAEYEETDFIYNQTNFVQGTFAAHGVDTSRIRVIKEGVNPDWFQPVPKEDDVFRVIFCGGLSVRKGLPYLLDAFQKLDLPNSELWLIGPRTADADFVLSLINSPKVIYKGVFREWELHKYYSQGTVFCLPSIEEGCAVVQAQALCCGLPLICTDAAGGSAFIRDGKEGFVIPMRSADAIAERLAALHADQARAKEMGDAARRLILENYTWHHYGDRIEKVFSELTGGAA